MFSDTDMISIVKSTSRALIQLLRVDKGAIGAALVTDGILAILVENGGMAARRQLVFGEENITVWRAANAHLPFIQGIVMQDFSRIRTQDEMGRGLDFVHHRLSCGGRGISAKCSGFCRCAGDGQEIRVAPGTARCRGLWSGWNPVFGGRKCGIAQSRLCLLW